MSEETDKQILDELRQMNRLLNKLGRTNTFGLVSALGLLFIFIVTTPFHQRIFSKFKPAPADSWLQARTLLYSENPDEGVEMIQRLLKQYPDYDYGYTLLGYYQQQIGNLKEAETNFTKAYELSPTEENEKSLTVIKKAIEKKNVTRNQQGNKK